VIKIQTILPVDNIGRKLEMLTVSIFNVLEHERVVAQLPQLHDGVHEGLRTTLAIFAFLRAICQHHPLTLHVSGIIFIIILLIFNLIVSLLV